MWSGDRSAVRRSRRNVHDKGVVVKYALLIFENASAWKELSHEEQQAIYGEYRAISERQDILSGEQLQAAASATRVRVAEGEAITTDGPFLVTRESLGGFFVLEAETVQAAVQVAAAIPAARM